MLIDSIVTPYVLRKYSDLPAYLMFFAIESGFFRCSFKF